MLELAQVVQEAVKQSSITVAIPTGVISSVATLMLYKGIPFLISTMRGKKNGSTNCHRPGEAKLCGEHSESIEEHGKAIAAQVEAQKNNETALMRIEKKVDYLPFKLIEIIQERK